MRVPGDKSISHRALILGALGSGPSTISGILQSADVNSTAGVLRAMGAAIPDLSAEFIVRGGGLRHLRQPQQELDCGNSGTTTRLMAGIVAGLPSIEGIFIGDESLSRRPMKRVAKPLEAMGASVRVAPSGGLPMTIRGAELKAIEWKSEVASAQVKSAVLLAALVSGIRASVIEPEASRDHTERMLRARGVSVSSDGSRVTIQPTTVLRALDVAVPGDPSSAAFFAALAVLQQNPITIEHVCVNPTRVGFFEQLRHMGASVVFENAREENGEPIADVIVEGGALRGTGVGQADVPAMVDELPLLACVAAYAEGETVITGAAELRVKESDRIAAVVSNLKGIGVDATELPDGMRIRGGGRSQPPLFGGVVTHGDHRLAMAFGILAALPGNTIAIDDPHCVAVSYPGFWHDLERLAAT